MKITGTFAKFHSVAVDLPDDATDEQQREALDIALKNAELNGAFDILVLHDSSNPRLVD